ncbi:MAG: hypothetical protein K5697_16475 [Lachnospiraceae bacterium]|nr:hypothetical protein [Lachnospiraceae bacterium]
MKTAEKYRKIIYPLLACLGLSLILELFLFNLNYWKGLGREEINVPLPDCSYFGQAEYQSDGSVLMGEADGNNIVQIGIADSTLKLESIAVEARCTDGNESWWGYMRTPYVSLQSAAAEMTVLLYDGADNTMLTERLLSGTEGEAEYFALPGKKGIQNVTLKLTGLKGKTLSLRRLVLNARFPMRFLPLRVLTVFLSLLMIFLLLPKGALWKDTLLTEEGNLKKRYAAGAGILFAALLVLVMVLISKNHVYNQGEYDFRPYTDLARALGKGQLYLDEEPSPELLSLEDPYDPAAREEIKAPFHLDYAFYNGKYYIYFGVVPCLLLYLPYHLVTGGDLPGSIALFLMMAGCYAGLFFLLKGLVRRYAPKCSAALAVLLWLGAASAFTMPAAMGDICNYYAPMLPAVCFFLFGMSVCLRARAFYDIGERKKSLRALAVGNLLFALIAGCRPQLVLGAACCLPFVLPMILKKKEKGWRIEWSFAAAFVLPYIPVAAGLMWYNAARFDSPFDFGALYNLTFAYLTQVHFNWASVGAGILYYLFRPFTLTGFYPYLGTSSLEWSNPSLLASRPSTGGIYFLYPLLFAGVLCFVPVKREKRELAWIGRIALLLTPVVAAITAVMGGLMDRYRMDFSVFAMLAMICGILIFQGRVAEKRKTVLRGLLLAAVLFVMTVSGLSYATEGLNNLKEVNPEAYIGIARAIEFLR